jgi:hypothetical protein
MAPPITAPIPQAEPAKVAHLLKKMTPDQRKEVMDLLPEELQPTQTHTIGFIFNCGCKSINMPFTFNSVQGSVGEMALVDSEANKNFIDKRTVARLEIMTRTLPVKAQRGLGARHVLWE